MSRQIFRDPVEDGAADPTVIRNQKTGDWWMFYTNRRPSVAGGKKWIHGTEIGVAVSPDDGASWHYRGTVDGLDNPAHPGRNTKWAPEIIRDGDVYHMYLTYIEGAPDSTTAGHDRSIIHLTSPDLARWTRHGSVELSSNRVIDACIFHCPDGLWRMWYKDEADGSSTWSATSRDLFSWTVEGRVIAGLPNAAPHEGPNVFKLGGWYWMIVDEWRGQAVYRSDDCCKWHRQGMVGDVPGADSGDRRYVRHADVEAFDGHAALFYFTHPEWDELDQAAGPMNVEARQTAIHHARLTIEKEELRFDRDIEGSHPILRS